MIILPVIGSLAALIVLAPLLIKKEYNIRRNIIIKQPADKIFSFVKQLKNQSRYNKWVMQDPNLRQEFRGNDGTKGFITAWEGNKQAGKGEQEIIDILENKRIDMELRFEKPFRNTGRLIITTTPVNGGTRVEWSMEGRNSYPLNAMNLFISKMLAADMDESLNNLKKILEQEDKTEIRARTESGSEI
jgi:hypothetical protein